MNRLVGYLAGASWAALAAVCVYGALTRNPSMIAINYVMAALFLAIGAFVTWRMRTVERLLDVSPAGPEAQAVRRVESIASLVMLVFGLTCLTGAVLRVWSEGAAAFG